MPTAASVRALETGVMRVVGNFRLNGIEAFVTRSGTGSSGIEQNVIVHEDRNEILTDTPVIWW